MAPQSGCRTYTWDDVLNVCGGSDDDGTKQHLASGNSQPSEESNRTADSQTVLIGTKE